MTYPQPIHESPQHTQTKSQKGDKTKTGTQHHTLLNTGAKEIQHLNPSGPNQAPAFSSMDYHD